MDAATVRTAIIAVTCVIIAVATGLVIIALNIGDGATTTIVQSLTGLIAVLAAAAGPLLGILVHGASNIQQQQQSLQRLQVQQQVQQPQSAQQSAQQPTQAGG